MGLASDGIGIMNRREFLQLLGTVATAVIIPPAWHRFMSSPSKTTMAAAIVENGEVVPRCGIPSPETAIPADGLPVPFTIPIPIGRDPQPHRVYFPFVRVDE